MLAIDLLVKKLEEYIGLENINEVIFNREKQLYLQFGSSYKEVIDESLDFEFLFDFCKVLAIKLNLRFDEKYPQLNCSIPNTRYRINALHHSVTANNQIALNIRIPNKNTFRLSDFKIKENLEEVIQKQSDLELNYQNLKTLITQKKNILIVGGTASGKTSLFNTLIEEIPLEERVISIEDSLELEIKNDNKVQMLVSKNENTGFTYEKALNSAMRMSPQRLLLGEVDTRNVMLFLRLSNTGHSGMISTIHANSPKEAIEAISMNIKMASGNKDIDYSAVEKYFKSGIDYIIQIKKINHDRVISEVLNVKKN
ncbi:ATPase, T2SS/T4P/T4SS family [Helicobacter anatolicus]|uniref:ATPase, T2SS/T4P/T4SS family n=1 Tax=Helicobacter anatolicus TaxID=2905874 RepID=UPI001E3C4432|nr:ATPase, T2SS/T4P/T4SS family [Helicobacter anatolicus]MCE3037691.1 Flp pilus assembly complex ATPase component TadA [Helicobacter anatolicus]